MKRASIIVVCVFILTLDLNAHDGLPLEEDSLTVMFWNLENFFDPRDGGQGNADTEFSAKGKRYWTWKRFNSKENMIAKTILWVGSKYDKLPDIIGFAEIENSFVLWSLCNSVPLKKAGYGYIHFDSPDHRGIDVGLLYRTSCMKVIDAEQFPLVNDGDTLATRAILKVKARHSDGRDYIFLVNHHPSKFSGSEASSSSRELAMRTMGNLCRGNLPVVISMGDFNDTPDAPHMTLVDGMMSNLGLDLAGKDDGSIRYQGKWELIDFFFVSVNFSKSCKMYVCKPEHLLQWDNSHPGFKPFRTYVGPRYNGGASDHLPIVLRCSRGKIFEFLEENSYL